MAIQAKKEIEINRLSLNKHAVTKDIVAVESPLEISITMLDCKPKIINKNISITMRTPENDANLALGFLFTEGIVSSYADVDKIETQENKINVFLEADATFNPDKLERHFYTSSSCGVCGKASIDAVKTERQIAVENSIFKVDVATILSLPKKLRAKQAVFESTGGLHAAALFSTDGKFIALKEDVGRHNALDKLIGASLQENILPLQNHLLLLSGRASFELIQKAAMAGIQFIIAVGAPSSLAIELAEEFNITLVGFLKNDGFNIYTGQNRLNLVSKEHKFTNLF